MTLVVRPGHLPGDALFSNVSLLLHGNADGSGNILDSSPSPKTVSKFGQAASATPPSYPNSNSAFGNAIAFDGVTPTGLTVPSSSAFHFEGNNFTFELWAYYGSTSGNQLLVGQAANNETQFLLYTIGTSLTYYLSSAGPSWNVASGTSVGTIATSQWYHIALVRDGSQFRPYLNGTAGTATTSSASLAKANTPLQIGANAARTGDLFNGYIAPLRITKGIARYETGTGANAGKMVFAGTNTLALPTEPFPDGQY